MLSFFFPKKQNFFGWGDNLPDLKSTALEQIESVLGEYNDAESVGRDQRQGHRLITRCRAVIHRVAGSGSPYAAQLSNLLNQKNLRPNLLLIRLIGVVEALHADLKGGYLETLSEFLHGELFGDFLEMADHLLGNGYKDAAAVIIGSTLEAHLRQLCQKFGIDVEVQDGRGNLRPKKADRMNSDLAGALAYNKLDQKSVTAWLDLRNKAAHGKYGEYNSEQVALLTQSVRDFISRNPA